MNFDAAQKYLLSLGHETLAIKLGLENTERLLDALGNPQGAFPSVQIAGTNGKGSTAAMLDAAARAARIKTGLYTSPHLVSITERIRIDGDDIAPQRFAEIVAEVRAAALRVQRASGALPTFFEQVTAAALVAFRNARVQLAILETGLGGRLDATTAARASLVAITPVALDHQEYLGATLAAIAAEKAAIIRPGVAAVISPHQPPEALEVIERRARECGITPRFAAPQITVHETRGDDNTVRETDDDNNSGRLRVSFKTEHDVYENVRLALRGRHQLKNAALAVALAETLRERGFQISRAAMVAGLETAVHPGRLELHRSTPPIIFDGAHNAAGARALRDYLDEFVHAPLVLVFGAMRDKELDAIAATLFPAAQRLVLTQPDNPRAASLDALARAVPASFDSDKITRAATAREALHAARSLASHGGIICVTGSLYLVGEVKSILRDETAGHILNDDA